jgi:hypothetical protein
VYEGARLGRRPVAAPTAEQFRGSADEGGVCSTPHRLCQRGVATGPGRARSCWPGTHRDVPGRVCAPSRAGKGPETGGVPPEVDWASDGPDQRAGCAERGTCCNCAPFRNRPARPRATIRLHTARRRSGSPRSYIRRFLSHIRRLPERPTGERLGGSVEEARPTRPEKRFSSLTDMVLRHSFIAFSRRLI